MRKSDVHEALAALYLRLNGYFTTGFIVHSPEWGEAHTEIDCLAIRHPHHEQPERELKTADFLNTGEKMIDLLLCEVKSCPDQLSFNEPIRTDPEALRAALRWAGVFTKAQVISVANRFQPLLQDGVSAKEACAGVVEGSCRVRPLLCCPPYAEVSVDRWCLTGSKIFCFADQCFNPPKRRVSSSTRYNFQQWGYPFTPIVQYLKDPGGPKQKTLDGLYERLKSRGYLFDNAS